MTILDRYIARQYLFNVAALLVILFTMVVAIDASWNAGRYLTKAASMASREGQEASELRRYVIAALLVADLWWPRLLQLFNYMVGLVLVGAMGFTCAQLVRHRELVAVLASGQSLVRIARPFMLVGAALVTLQGLNQEFLLPRVAPLLMRDTGDAGERGLGATAIPVTTDGARRLWYAASFDADHGTLTDVYVWERDEAGVATRRIYAPAATWTRGGWRLEGATIESRRGHAPPEVGDVHVPTDLDPTALRARRYEGYSQNLSTAQIGQMLRRLERLGADSAEAQQKRERLQTLRFGRFSVMACNLLTLAACLPFFLTRAPGNMVVQSLKCAPLAVVALVGSVLGAAAPAPGLPAAVGVFVPALVMLPVAVAMRSMIRT